MRATPSLLAATTLAAALAFSSSPANAQRTPGFTVAPTARPAPIGAPLRGHLVRANRAHHHRANTYGSAFYPDYDYPDDLAPREPAPPQRAITATVAPAATAAPTKIPEPLVMELRGDHWVRLASKAAEPNGPFYDPAAARATPAPAPLPAAILVFRDGHQEEAARYTIIGRSISIRSDYYATGSWTRTIPLAQLDLPATLQLNQFRGAHFALPSRPGEVMMRP